MGSASITLFMDRWVVRVDGRISTCETREEAIAEARRQLGPRGGEIAVHPGDGEVERIDVIGGPPTGANPKTLGGFVDELRAKGVAAPVSPATEAPAQPAKPADLHVAATELRTGYQEARNAIERIDDSLERDIGLGTLRLEANFTVDQLRGNGVGVTEEELAPLTSYVKKLNGGESTETAIAKIDQTSQSVLIELSKTLLGLKAASAVVLVLGLASSATGALTEAGAGAKTAIVTGLTGAAAYMLLRGGGALVQATGKALDYT